jgi:hypothetical protein
LLLGSIYDFLDDFSEIGCWSCNQSPRENVV